MRRQEIGRRYLAGFVMASAIIYFAATCVITIMVWRDIYPTWLAMNWFVLGLVPSAVAFALGRRAWSANSIAISLVALIILVVALELWQLFVVSF
jgi:hypothetical protein